ncbi:MAG: hypothetical protein IJ929_02170 [Prevotella sp.]|nr:hypothetical protein [Prevotella sp.]
MKKILMATAAMTLMTMSVLTSCTIEDNPAPPELTIVDPVADIYLYDKDMDRDVRPGDSFYHFAVGGWIKSHDPNDISWLTEGMEYINSVSQNALINSEDPQIKHLVSNLFSTPDANKEMDAINKLMSAMFDENGNLDILRGWGILSDMGYSPLVARSLTPQNNLFYYVITAGVNSLEEELRKYNQTDQLRTYARICLMPFVKDTSQLDDWVDKVMDLANKAWAVNNPQLTGSLMERLQGDKLPQYSLANAMKGRRAGAIDFSPEKLAESYHLDLSRDSIDSKPLPFFDELANQDPELLYLYTAYNVMMENCYFMVGYHHIDVSKNLNAIHSFIKTAVPALINTAEAEAFIPVVNQEECLADLERLRGKMSQRIQNLDWMSDATKEAAQQKLQKMHFYAGVPENLIVKGDFNLTGETLLEDIIQARTQCTTQINSYVGKHTYGYLPDYILMYKTLSYINASYAPDFNGVYIFPVFCSKVMYPQSDEEEDMLRRYATFYVFAHELCHGFDSRGSQYDGEGYMRDWWAPADKQQFEEKKQQMVDRFNELWAYEGQHANGVKTLGENMADFGGFRLTFELFKELMIEKGYYGESLKHMLREYFLHFAQVWKEEDRGTEGYMLQYLNDVHSAYFNRVNGIARLMDEWYDLFQVKSGDIYVAPADRPHIW